MRVLIDTNVLISAALRADAYHLMDVQLLFTFFCLSKRVCHF